jgi:hypothetical protein
MLQNPTAPKPAPFTIAVADAPRLSARVFGMLGVILSFVVMIAAVFKYRELQFETIEAMIPHTWQFWLLFVVIYLQGPVFDWLIFRRLWNIPLWAGMAALLRKLVSNELVLGYLGEAQFYAWARSRANFVAAPFGAIKDVAVLSALTGNAATVGMLVYAWPLIASGSMGVPVRSAFLSLSVVLAVSCAILLLRKKLFSLSRRELWFITGLHFTRIAAFISMSAWLWHLVLPDVSVGLWMVLGTLRMLVSRLPLLPNKDIVFAGMAVFLLGHDIEIAALMTMLAVLTMGAHVVSGVVSGVFGMIESRRVAQLDDAADAPVDGVVIEGTVQRSA